MKKIIFIVLSVLSLVSCSKEQIKELRESQIAPTDEWWYKGHHYLIWDNSQRLNSIVHDPDCSCHLDTLEVYVIENNDTTYVIRKKQTMKIMTCIRIPLIKGIDYYAWELHVIGNKYDQENKTTL